MSYRSLGIAIAVALSWWSANAALAESRIALVIGNSDYETVSALPNPANDARAMTDLLAAANFEVVAEPNLTQSEMRRVIADFAARLKTMGGDTVALVFYAGHGLQVDGENFLVPVDVHLSSEADVPLQAVRLADLMNARAAAPSRTRIVILDSCRNNPFSEINKTSGRGLAIVDAPTGSIVSYSTSPGSEAEDGEGINSPYTTALLTVTKEQGLPIEQAFKRVRSSVHQSTNGRQTPWESSSLTGDFYFFPNGAKPPAATTAAEGGAPTIAKASRRSVDSWRKELQSRPPREAYDIVISEDKAEAYQAYLELFPTQSSAPRVRDILDRRRMMIAWYIAVTTNTPASYQAFLASYANTDLTLTALRLLNRASNRSFAPATQVASTCPCPELTPSKRRAETKEEKRAASRTTPKQEAEDTRPRRTETKQQKRTASRTTPKRQAEDTGPRRNRLAPRSSGSSTAENGISPEIGVGIGIGIVRGLLLGAGRHPHHTPSALTRKPGAITPHWH